MKVFIALLSDMSSFNFGVFSVAVGIFTVLYAFILSRKDSLRDLNDLIKEGKANPFIIQRVSFFAAHTLRWRRINNNIAVVIFSSLMLYFANTVLKYLPLTLTTIMALKVLLLLTTALALYIIVMIFLVFKNYIKETSIN